MPVIANNKKAYFDYFISDNVEAGIALEGSEVKSVRAGGISLVESFIKIVNGEMILKNAYIKTFDKSSAYSPNERRDRKLLLNKKEIEKLSKKSLEKGFSVMPLKVYTKGNLIKIEIGLAKGKKLYDKRETLKEKSIKLEIEKALKK